MPLTTKDWYSYPVTTSTTKEGLYIVAIPDGGGGYNLKNITKENLFTLQNQGIKFIAVAGPNVVLDMDSGVAQLLYINPGIFLLVANTFGVGNTGTDNNAQMDANGNFKAGNASNSVPGSFSIVDQANHVLTITREVPENMVGEWAILEDQAVRSKPVLNGDTRTVSNEYFMTEIIDQTGGSIAACTIQFPDSPRNAQIANIIVYGNITAITMAATTATIEQPLTTASGAITSASYQYISGVDIWWRITEPNAAAIPVPVTSLQVVPMVNLGDVTVAGDFVTTTIITPGAGTVFTVNFPASPVEAQTIKVTTQESVSSMIFQAPGGATVDQNPSGSVTEFDSFEWSYQVSSTTWWRVR